MRRVVFFVLLLVGSLLVCTYIPIPIPKGNLPQKMCLFFWAYFIRIAKRNNFVEEIFSEPFFAEKTQSENSNQPEQPELFERKRRKRVVLL
jgi:hypothetical protein